MCVFVGKECVRFENNTVLTGLHSSVLFEKYLSWRYATFNVIVLKQVCVTFPAEFLFFLAFHLKRT